MIDLQSGQNAPLGGELPSVQQFSGAVGIDYVSRMTGLTRLPAEIAAEAQSFVVRIECHG